MLIFVCASSLLLLITFIPFFLLRLFFFKLDLICCSAFVQKIEETSINLDEIGQDSLAAAPSQHDDDEKPELKKDEIMPQMGNVSESIVELEVPDEPQPDYFGENYTPPEIGEKVEHPDEVYSLFLGTLSLSLGFFFKFMFKFFVLLTH